MSSIEFEACGEDDFTCENHQCIPGNLRCDAKYDCNDHSDELNCGKISDR